MVEEVIEWMVRTGKHLISLAWGDIASEALEEAINKAGEKAEKKQKRFTIKGCLRRLLGIFGAIVAIVLLGILNSTEVNKLLIEQLQGPDAAAAFAEQYKDSTLYVGLFFIGIVYLAAVNWLFRDFRKPGTGIEQFFDAYLFVVATLIAWALARLVYNDRWEAGSAMSGDWFIILTVGSSFIAVVPALFLLQMIQDREIASWKALLIILLIMIAGISLVLFFGWDAYGHLGRGDF